MWDLPRPGLEPMAPALADGFLTTAPPGKPSKLFLVANLTQVFRCIESLVVYKAFRIYLLFRISEM